MASLFTSPFSQSLHYAKIIRYECSGSSTQMLNTSQITGGKKQGGCVLLTLRGENKNQRHHPGCTFPLTLASTATCSQRMQQARTWSWMGHLQIP